ncbi:hypothetical protein D3C71_2118030 [compost metagenome]
MPLFTAIRIFSRLASHSHCSRLRSILLAPMERPPPFQRLATSARLPSRISPRAISIILLSLRSFGLRAKAKPAVSI